MNKKIVLLCVLIVLSFSVFGAPASNKYMTFGAEYSSIVQTGHFLDTEMRFGINSIGFQTSNYTFSLDNPAHGFFAQVAFLLPTSIDLTIEGVKTTVKAKEIIDYGFLENFLTGYAYRKIINDKAQLFLGAGVSLQMLNVSTKYDYSLDLLVGFGGSAELRYLLPNAMAVHLGLAGNVSIFGYSVLSGSDYDTPPAGNLPFTIRPYISVGMEI